MFIPKNQLQDGYYRLKEDLHLTSGTYTKGSVFYLEFKDKKHTVATIEDENEMEMRFLGDTLEYLVSLLEKTPEMARMEKQLNEATEQRHKIWYTWTHNDFYKEAAGYVKGFKKFCLWFACKIFLYDGECDSPGSFISILVFAGFASALILGILVGTNCDSVQEARTFYICSQAIKTGIIGLIFSTLIQIAYCIGMNVYDKYAGKESSRLYNLIENLKRLIYIPENEETSASETLVEIPAESPAETIARVQREMTFPYCYEEKFHNLSLIHTVKADNAEQILSA